MSAVRKTKKKFQSPRSKFTYVRNSKNNPSNLNMSHNHPDDIFNEDNLQEYFNKYNESNNNSQQQQEDMIIENSSQEYSNDNQEESDNDQDQGSNDNQDQESDNDQDQEYQEYFNDNLDQEYQEYSNDDLDQEYQEYSNDDLDQEYQEYSNDDLDQEYSDNNDDQNNQDENQEYSDNDNNRYDQDDDQDNNQNNNQDDQAGNFKNISTMMIFTWITKHMIGRNAYKDLIKILKNEDFNLQDIPHNIQTLKEQNKYLPLYKIRKNTVNINKEKVPSNSQFTKIAYSISILDHISTILKNTQISPLLYFGPGIENDQKSEFWHGKIWQESPLFGITNIKYNKGMKYNII